MQMIHSCLCYNKKRSSTSINRETFISRFKTHKQGPCRYTIQASANFNESNKWSQKIVNPEMKSSPSLKQKPDVFIWEASPMLHFGISTLQYTEIRIWFVLERERTESELIYWIIMSKCITENVFICIYMQIQHTLVYSNRLNEEGAEK